MAQKLKNILKALEQFDKERIFWLRLSALVVGMIMVSTASWNYIQGNHFGWIFFIVCTTVSMVWWYWTMKIIRTTLEHRKEEVSVLIDIVDDIKSIKIHVKELSNQNVDNSK